MYRLLLLLLALALSAPLSQAQSQAQSNALTTALDHLRASRATLGLSQADLADIAVTDEYTSRHNGVTHLYLRQKVNGVEVYNGRLSAHVTTDGRVVGVKNQFLADASGAAGEATPSITADAAVEAAARHLDLPMGTLSVAEPLNERHQVVFSDARLSLEPIPVQLVYVAPENGALRLAWDLLIMPPGENHYWSLRLDAQTGAVLEQQDLVINDEWGIADAEAAANAAPLAASPIVGARGASSGSYNVWGVPLESPSHGARELQVNPHLPNASPLGWHDDGNAQYTITRGNNVHAYEDRDANDLPGYSPDGGAGLVFDFPYDPSQLPIDYEDLAITNLFYWNNIIHDALYQYGFDEVAGNYQTDNFGNGGLGNDYVRAEAQDGSGTNNANFFPTADGSRGRMQMFFWNPASEFVITSPNDIAGEYPNGDALFGGQPPTDVMEFEIIPVESGDGGDYPGGEPDEDLADRGCEEIFNTSEVAGKIALVERGDCAFALKAWNAQQAGAIGVVIHNNSRNGAGETGGPEDLINMSADQNDLPFPLEELTIWAVFVQQSTGALIFNNQPVEGYARVLGVQRDSDLDNGVIIHEYGHGVSNRLTGGPSTLCLGGNEQMGEGWSDYLGLMLTMTDEQTGPAGRGIGTYLNFEDPNSGSGIRNFPYSTSMSVNPETYENVGGVSIPHGVGAIWANMLWEMTWNLIDEYGFDSDVMTGTGGNNLALQLVMDGMKLQGCNPGFVDGRNAILTADTLNNDAANSAFIWRAFAKRGLGFSADQGSAGSVTDGTPAFDLPEGVEPVANEDSSVPGVYELTAAYPNPFSRSAQFTLEVAETQAVTVAVYDVMGRMVSMLHDGALNAGTRHGFEVEGASLASGVYLVRVTGEQFAETRRVTLLR